MTTILTYLLPAIMDMILPAVFFMAQVATAQGGASPSTVANLITVWAAVYMVSALALGRVVTRRNAARLIMLSCGVTAGLSIAFAATTTTNTRVLYLLMGMEGIGMALFFVPFQVFMKVVGESKQRSINRSVGLYTFSWSLGFAAGPFVAAVLWKYLGWQWSHLVNAAAALFVFGMIWVLKHAAAPHSGETVEQSSSGTVENTHPNPDPDLIVVSPRHRVPASPRPASFPDPGPRTPNPDAHTYASMPDLAWMGWVFSGLGCLAARLVYGLYPSSAAALGISRIDQGLTLFVLSAAQAMVGLLLGRFHWWMYRPLPILATGACGVCGLVLFAASRSTASFYLAAGCFGVYSGAFFYYLVFHSLVHPEKSSRYVAVNEATVGLTSLLGPFVGGLIADRYAPRNSYLATAVILLAAVLTQGLLHAVKTRRHRLALEQIPAESLR